MTCSTSHKRPAVLVASFIAVVSAMVSTAVGQEAAVSATTPLGSRLVSSLQLKPESRPQWARFSPSNPQLVLVDLDGGGLLLSLPQGKTRSIPKGLAPIGWLGGTLVVRDQKGSFQLLDAGDLTASKSLATGSLPLPWTFGKDQRLGFNLEMSGRALTTHQDKAVAAVAIEGDGRNVVDVGGRVLFRGDKKIYKIVLSPDTYKIVVYYGNTDYVLFNSLTRRTIKLPSAIHHWTWLPDSSTLLGEVSRGGKPGREEVTSTEFYIYELGSARLTPVALPPQARGLALKIFDVSTEGRILVDAERVVPRQEYLGLMVLELLWK